MKHPNGETGGWTDAEDQILEAGFRDGLGDRALAELLPGRSPRAVHNRRHRLGFVYESPKPIDRERLLSLWRAGRTAADVAAALATTAHTVEVIVSLERRRLAAAGVDPIALGRPLGRRRRPPLDDPG